MIVRSTLAVAGAGAIGLVSIAGSARPAVDRRTDEAEIRALIAQRDAGKPVPRISDAIAWMGAFQKPIVGDEAPVARTHERGLENRVPNTTKTTTTVRRIVVSESGDMAYEYSDGTLDFDLKDGTHISSPNSTLRVWQKQGGQWRIAAMFTLTHYRD